MAKCSLNLFCLPEELIEIADEVCSKWMLSWLVFRDLDSDGVIVRRAGMSGPFHTAFLFLERTEIKSLKWSDQRPRDMGWITITAGAVVRDDGGPTHLRLTVIAGEDAAAQIGEPVKYLRWLKRLLQSSGKVHWQVEGENTVTGGRSVYKDIGYTNGAARLFREGVEWKDLYSTRVVFRPTA